MRFCTLLAFIGLIFITPAASGQAVTHFTNYTNDDGVPQSTVWSIGQDKNGFIWAGTADGICRFDGYTFHTYKTAAKDSNAINSDRSCSFYTDHAGNLWVASFKGLSRYNADADNFTNCLAYQPVNEAVHVNRIYGEDSSFIWAGMAHYGLVKINKATHKVYCIKKAGDEDFSTCPEWDNGFVAGNNVWFCCGGSIMVYNSKTGSLQKISLGFYARAVANLNDTVLMAQSRTKSFFINKRTCAFASKSCNLASDSIEVYSIFISDPGQAILATTKGVYYLNTATATITGYLQNFGNENKKAFALAVCIYKDRSGNVWIGTDGTGLAKIAFQFKKFKLYASPGAASNMVKSIYADSATLYTGYFNNGMDIFNRARGFIKNVSVAAMPHSTGNNVYGIAPNTGQSLLLYTSGPNLLCLYNTATSRLEELYRPLANAIPGYKTKNNKYCFFTRTRGSRVFISFNEYLLSTSMPFEKNTVPQIVGKFNGLLVGAWWEGRKGRLWIGTNNGLYYGEANNWQKIKLPEDIQVITINQDDAGNMWAGTVHGIYVIDARDSIIQHYTVATGLLNEVVYGILKDNDGNMWFSTNKGIGVYWRAQKKFRYFTKDDGLQGNEFNTGAYFKAADGELFFGGINGTNSFYPQDILDNPYTPPVQVTGIKVFDDPYNAGIPSWQVHNIILPYTNNTLAFEFAMPEFTNTLKNQYACMMEGVDKGWLYLGSKNTERYAGLAPGHYTFKIKAANNDGVWATQLTTISITIVPPYWQRTWFRVLYIILAVCLVVVIANYLQKRKYKQRLAALELQQKIQLERERISRDLHDNVGTQLSLISKNIEDVLHPLKNITEEERIRKVKSAGQRSSEVISTLRETIWALNKEQITLEEFADQLKTFTHKQLEHYDNINVAFNEHPGNCSVIVQPAEVLNLFRICQETIANTVKYAEATQLIITIAATEGKYCIIITDNGKGFNPALVNKNRHYGLQNIQHRAAEIGGAVEITSSPGAGTTTTICKK